MKKSISIAALFAFLLGSSSLFAEVKYGPVITVKPKGYTEQPAESKSKPAPAKNNVKSGQPQKRTGLLLPAVQKAR